MTLLSMTINATEISLFQSHFSFLQSFFSKYSSVNGFSIKQKYTFEIIFVTFKIRNTLYGRKYKIAIPDLARRIGTK
jgi:hypothetical protein